MELENPNANGSALPGAQPSGPRAAAREAGRAIEETARHQAASAKEQIRSFAEVGKDRVAEQLDQVAHALRATGENMRGGEQADLARYTDTLGDQIERASRYLREHHAIDLVDGVERFARQQPALFLGGAFALGLLAGRFLKSGTSESFGGGERAQAGYSGREEPVLTTPVQRVGGPVQSIAGTVQSAGGPATPGYVEPITPPAGGSVTPVYPPPSGTFRGPGGEGQG